MTILTAPALVIAPAFQYLPHHPLIGWHNLVLFGNVTADSEDTPSYPVTNVANDNTGLRWQSLVTTEQLVTISDLDGQSDYVGLARHNFGSGDIEVAVEAITAEPGAVWEEVFPAVDLEDDAPTILRFAKDFYIGVRLRLFPTSTVPRCAILHVGALTALKPGLSPGYTPLPRGLNITTYNGRSEAGERLGSIVTGADIRSVAQVKDIDADYYTAELAAFVAGANRGDPFFFAWSPESFPSEVAFAQLESTAKPILNRTTHNFDLSLDMGGLAL